MFDRVILSLYAFALTIVSFMFVLVSLGWRDPVGALLKAIEFPTGRTALGVMSSFIFLAGLRFLYYGFRRVPAQAVIHDSGMGEVRISLTAVRSLVTRVVSRIPGVREVRASVYLTSQGSGIGVDLELKVSLDANMPELADKVQKAVASYVRDVVGVNVESVKVSVLDLAADVRR